jgi:hypothetical protein
VHAVGRDLENGAEHSGRPSSSATVLLTGLLAVLYGPGAPHLPGSRSRPAPQLVGLTIDAALVTARADGFTVAVSEEFLDPASPLGTVDLQGPPPGPLASTAGGPLSVVVAVPDAHGCRADQLQRLATSGVPGACTAFGTILFRNVGARPCTLLGPLDVTATDDLGKPLAVTDAVPVTQPLVLSALSPGPPQ